MVEERKTFGIECVEKNRMRKSEKGNEDLEGRRCQIEHYRKIKKAKENIEDGTEKSIVSGFVGAEIFCILKKFVRIKERVGANPPIHFLARPARRNFNSLGRRTRILSGSWICLFNVTQGFRVIGLDSFHGRGFFRCIGVLSWREG